MHIINESLNNLLSAGRDHVSLQASFNQAEVVLYRVLKKGSKAICMYSMHVVWSALSAAYG